jgi:uncharacterized protein (DUF427 family)
MTVPPPDDWSAEQTMGLSWQQGPLGRNPNGQFLVPGMPQRALYAEPLRRRMPAELDGRTVVQSDDAVVLFEPGRYPVAYFPIGDFADAALRPTDRRTEHPELGETAWFEVIGGTRHAARGAWQHVTLPDHAAILRGKVALAWHAMDAFYDIDGVSHAAWSYRAPFADMAAIGDLVSFEPDRVEVTLDGERLELEPGQTVVSHGVDRNLSVDEAGGLTAVLGGVS